MASKDPDEAPQSATEEDNLTRRLEMKRTRRVSFADEITSVRIFCRDEDYETPPESKPSSGTADAEARPENEASGFFGSLGGGDSDDEGIVNGRKSFLRPMGSPSPGSSSPGSVTSNDEDNFIGPVSASFIRPGRLSDSAASDEIHEETLDTTAFSMHYRSLARSDSGELKTPTAVRLVFEEKTATNDPNLTDSGSLMALTDPKRPSSQSPVALEKIRGGKESDDSMSIVDENPKTYNYGGLSPTLDALLGECSMDLITLENEYLRADQNGMSYMDHRNSRDSELVNLDTNENLVEAASVSHGILLEGNERFVEHATSECHHLNESSRRESSTLEGSPISLSGRQQPAILNTPTSAKISDIASPSSKRVDVQSNEHMKHADKSISQFKFPDTLYSGSSIKQGIDKLKHRLSKYSSISSPFSSVLDKNNEELQSDYGSTPIASLVEKLFTADGKNEDISMVSVAIDQVETPRNTGNLVQNKEITGLAKDGQSLNSMSTDVLSKDIPNKITSGSSPYGLASSITKVMQKELAPGSAMNVRAQSSPAKEPLQSPRANMLISSPSWYEATHSPSRKEPTESPSRLDTSSATHSVNVQSFPGKDIASTRSDSGGPESDNLHQGHMSQSPFFTKDVEISLERKKRRIGVVLEDDGKPTYKTPRIQKSSDADRSGNYDYELMYNQSNKILHETEKTEGDRTQKQWLDIWVAFSGDAEQLLSPSIKKLNLKAIGTLEDSLIHLLKVKKYEMLASEIKSQSVSDHLSVRHNKRVAETRLMLYKVACEKAKLQLMGAKQVKLQKRVLLLKSGIQECKMLKLNYSQQSKSGRRNAQVDDSHLQSCTVNVEGEQQDASDTMSKMKQDVKDLHTKINSLSNFFHSYCKLKLGDRSCADTLAIVYDDLKRRKCCRLLRQELQLWNVHRFENQDGLYNLFLKYQDYLIQRFTINFGPESSIVISNQLNDINIVKMFPNMDAHVAFAFVLNAEVTKRFVDSNCLAQETQVTQSLLRNLLDVIEEVQMAHMEIWNLIQTKFHSSSGQQLDLQLCFINFHTGIKVTLTLDVTCLNSGVYPLEILPHQVQSPAAVAQKLQSVSGEIRSVAENLEVGYSRIMRLCRRVSQVLQGSRT
ncbi:uncharacterized protein LOC21390286 [Morus notabilis]|uniref:uncharacterized protein LOC21390286 n=1 Tax=Morus notabilis TaxID=981085 RepID=UPI000CECE831|nr:uncharacterized protein LOC21390286 [Morus notabilis]